MDITIETGPEAVIAQMTGDLDGSTAPVAQQQLLAWATPGSRIILDMTHVGYMSSAGLRALLTIYRQVKSNQGRLVLLGLSEEIRDIMSTTGFLAYFSVSDSLTEALSTLHQ